MLLSLVHFTFDCDSVGERKPKLPEWNLCTRVPFYETSAKQLRLAQRAPSLSWSVSVLTLGTTTELIFIEPDVALARSSATAEIARIGGHTPLKVIQGQ